jgi:galactose oxidase-like protein
MPTAGGNWTNLTGFYASGPPGRRDAAGAFDSADGYALSFGGKSSSSVFGDTWSFSSGSWTNRTPLFFNGTNSPTGRYGASMAFDTATNSIILFGGRDSSDIFGDTWEYRSGGWTQINATGPSPRAYASMVYDPAIGELVLFGGATLTQDLNDTWEFSGTAWKNISEMTVGAPSPRLACSAVYYPPSKEIVLFGGFGNATGLLNDTWNFGSSGWSQLHVVPAPPPRSDAQVTYDTLAQSILLYGGNTNNATRWGDLWEFTGTPGHWVLLSGSETGFLASRSGATFVSVTGPNPPYAEILLFGGSTTTSVISNETWLYGATLPLGVTNPVVPGRWFEQGVETNFSAHALGGTPGYAYAWSGLPSGCDSYDLSSISCIPGAGRTTSQTFEISVGVSDSAGSSVSSAQTILVVAPPPKITSFTPASIAIPVDSRVTFVTSASGGAGWRSYNYTHLPDGCASLNASSLACVPTVSGVYDVKVTVSDALGVSPAVGFSLLTVLGSSGQGGTTMPILEWVTLGVGVVVAALCVALYYRRRRSGGTAPSPSSAGPDSPG